MDKTNCMCVKGACETWLVMWLPLTVSRWQNALRDKRCMTARCDILKGSSVQSQILGLVFKLFLCLIKFKSSEDEAQASFKTNKPTNNHGELFFFFFLNNAWLFIRALPHIKHSAAGWSFLRPSFCPAIVCQLAADLLIVRLKGKFHT